MRYLDSNRFVQVITTVFSAIFAFIVVNTLSSHFGISDEWQAGLKLSFIGAFAILTMMAMNGIYGIFYNRLQWVRARQGPNYAGRFEGVWVQSRYHIEGDVTEKRYTVLKIDYVKSPGYFHRVRGVAYGNDMSTVRCTFNGVIEIFGDKNLKFEVDVSYEAKNPNNKKPDSKTINDLEFSLVSKQGLYSKYEGIIYDSHNPDYRKVLAYRVSKIPDNFMTFKLPDDYSFDEVFEGLQGNTILPAQLS